MKNVLIAIAIIFAMILFIDGLTDTFDRKGSYHEELFEDDRSIWDER
jgi:hypothetical protein